MQNRLVAAVVALASLLNSSSAAAQALSPAVLVKRVIDGDTIEIASVGRIKLLGIDAPEIGRRPATPTRIARDAQERLSGLVLNRWARLEYEDSPRGRSSSRSAYVFLEDGTFVNAWVVKEGLAKVAARTGLRRLGELQRAEREAQSLRLGVWSDPPNR